MASKSVTPARKRRFQTLEITGENGERQWVLINASPEVREFVSLYEELTPGERRLTDLAIGAVAAHALTAAQAKALDRASGDQEAMRAWAATITPAQRVRIDQVWAEAQR